jgi:hypothetical protein
LRHATTPVRFHHETYHPPRCFQSLLFGPHKPTPFKRVVKKNSTSAITLQCHCSKHDQQCEIAGFCYFKK